MASHHQPDDIVRLASANSPSQAHLWAQMLDEQGILCRVVGESFGALDIGSPGLPAPEVWVFRRDLERARRILRLA